MDVGRQLDADEQRAVSLYAIAGRDFCDFLDMMREPETSIGSLELLLKMCRHEGKPGTDMELNRLMAGPVEQEITNRGQVPRQKARRGFAAMSAEKQQAIASLGGKAAHAKGTAHKFDSAEAREAGRKGGQAAQAAQAAQRARQQAKD